MVLLISIYNDKDKFHSFNMLCIIITKHQEEVYMSLDVKAMSCHHTTKISMEIPPQDNQWAKIQPEGLQNLPIYHDFWWNTQARNKAMRDKWGQSLICKHCLKKFSSEAGLKNHICHRSDSDCLLHM